MAKITSFTDSDKNLHLKVQKAFQESQANKKRVGHTGGVKRYSPQLDLFILQLLDTDGLAVKYGTSDTETQYEICDKIAARISEKFKDDRSSDSIYYRIRKLMKMSSLDEIDYRHENKARVKKEKAATAVAESC